MWRQRHESALDQTIREARERGAFDNLQGAGRPQALDEPLAARDERWLGNHILRNNGVVPPWVEASRQLEAARARSADCVRAWSDCVDPAAKRSAAAELERAWTAENAAIRVWNKHVPTPDLEKYAMPVARRWQRLTTGAGLQ